MQVHYHTMPHMIELLEISFCKIMKTSDRLLHTVVPSVTLLFLKFQPRSNANASQYCCDRSESPCYSQQSCRYCLVSPGYIVDFWGSDHDRQICKRCVVMDRESAVVDEMYCNIG
jgi:hypothetical protein